MYIKQDLSNFDFGNIKESDPTDYFASWKL